MRPVPFREVNRILKPPRGQEETCGDLPALVLDGMTLSAWLPSAAELADLNVGRPLWLAVMMAPPPPVLLSTDCPVEATEEGPKVIL